MPYTLHIKRQGGISLQEWVKSVESTPGVKIDNSEIEIVNPNTGEKVSMFGNDGDAAILCEIKGFFGFGKKEQWIKSIQFSKGEASFNAGEDIENPNNTVHKAVSKLAKILGAKIVGDEGEYYQW